MTYPVTPLPQRAAPVSVLIPVKNEERNMERCLKSLQWADEIIVVDSQSTDQTIALAEKFGAKVVQFHFNGVYPKKKNWAIESIPWKHEWLLIVDADEEIPEPLAREIMATIADPKCDGYYLNFRYMFLGHWIRHCGYYPVWVLRLFRHAKGRYEKMPVKPGSNTGDNEAHEHVILDGATGKLTNDVLHYPYPSIDVWVQKHNRYSNWEAELYERFLQGNEEDNRIGGARRWKRTLKRIFLRLPFRWVFRFLYAYVFRLGFLDGKPGFILCYLLSFYDFLSYAKVYEKKQTQ